MRLSAIPGSTRASTEWGKLISGMIGLVLGRIMVVQCTLSLNAHIGVL